MPAATLSAMVPGMTESLLYFAYGSNLYSPRLRFRVPGCLALCVATLSEYQLRFHKIGADGTAKCDAFRTGRREDVVMGVVYEIPRLEKALLDRHEGLGRGYGDAEVELATAENGAINAFTYVALQEAIDPTLRPYGWYKDFVLSGADEHGLPEDYVDAFIRGVPDLADPDRLHEERRRAEVAFAATSR